MISNYDRIFREIQIEARRASLDLGIDPEVLERLTMEIVELEDRHRISHIHGIKKQMRTLIEDTAVGQGREESERD